MYFGKAICKQNNIILILLWSNQDRFNSPSSHHNISSGPSHSFIHSCGHFHATSFCTYTHAISWQYIKFKVNTRDVGNMQMSPRNDDMAATRNDDFHQRTAAASNQERNALPLLTILQ